MTRLLLAVCALLILIAQARAGTIDDRPVPVELPKASWVDRAGGRHDATSAGARVTLVHLWATWCGTCRTEFPALDRLQESFRDRGLAVAAISVDRMGFDAVDRLDVARDARALAIFHDPNREAAVALGVVGLPTTLVVDRTGREIARVTGAVDWSSPEVAAKVEAWLAR